MGKPSLCCIRVTASGIGDENSGFHSINAKEMIFGRQACEKKKRPSNSGRKKKEKISINLNMSFCELLV